MVNDVAGQLVSREICGTRLCCGLAVGGVVSLASAALTGTETIDSLADRSFTQLG